MVIIGKKRLTEGRNVKIVEYKMRTNAKQQLSISPKSVSESEPDLNSGKLSGTVKRFGYACMSGIMTLQCKSDSNI